MPELPEVETVKNSLYPIIGKKILSINTSGKKFRIAPPANFSNLLLNKRITDLARRSKYILIHLEDNNILVIHLGMSGKILLNTEPKSNKHNHLEIDLTGDSKLIFNDARRFGLYTVIPESEINTHNLFKNLGVEPLTPALNQDYLHEIFKNRSAPIKPLLMDASLIVGVGNIYAAESLFRSQISPLRAAKSLNKEEITTLCEMIKVVLLEAIESGGSTLRDYVRSSGDIGYFQHKFKVYGRVGQECYICEEVILNNKMAGRSTFYCPNCQF
ncbi:formamidopyrimidine/5-formyluracil/ 5-hydroxymethyluracil DNA glycosylase [endosymbiont of Acanthamoeba sp. UWC8]|uniref:bifunctional DNA-formamidopyrimidine glycosylase/DNA-(apurinic or apyrimidinic site) lyase n=1 Tax=endosymbiont of Acanthamoeba sp. UWC8 TaxID=86106 RepID=UPI0004D107FB|nr:bifunctional DNA-formamidopyrimidine glycosylase/DNA-(apurinic or apyrimidinic site) lyase [endosymbiont of Acanthamoeba sp. UWC8]AIF80616.1 formamidopyrimidine/5-formyluracil/ 5-hydroxymethyluracil DNA glycosylase [endosymbiont of Acanthamoeba sp. UWC8]